MQWSHVTEGHYILQCDMMRWIWIPAASWFKVATSCSGFRGHCMIYIFFWKVDKGDYSESFFLPRQHTPGGAARRSHHHGGSRAQCRPSCLTLIVLLRSSFFFVFDDLVGGARGRGDPFFLSRSSLGSGSLLHHVRLLFGLQNVVPPYFCWQ